MTMGEVLLDTGANEVVTTQTKFPNRATRLDLFLANGDVVEALRARGGEVIVRSTEKGNTLCGMNRLVQIWS